MSVRDRWRVCGNGGIQLSQLCSSLGREQDPKRHMRRVRKLTGASRILQTVSEEVIGADVMNKGGSKNAYRTGSLIKIWLYQDHLVSFISTIDIQALIKHAIRHITDFQTRKWPYGTRLRLTHARCYAVDHSCAGRKRIDGSIMAKSSPVLSNRALRRYVEPFRYRE